MTLEIRTAHRRDAAAVHDLLAAAARELAAQGFRNWVSPYPLALIEIAIDDGALVVAHDHTTLVGTYTLRTSPSHPYVPAPWSEPGLPSRYLNRMAVVPASQGRGIGRMMLGHVAARAADEGARAVRCDVLSANRRLRGFYERAGYRAFGTREHSGWTFTCYELNLTSAARA